jgi:hypothetical protein
MNHRVMRCWLRSIILMRQFMVPISCCPEMRFLIHPSVREQATPEAHPSLHEQLMQRYVG